jgi:hypothetical protein
MFGSIGKDAPDVAKKVLRGYRDRQGELAEQNASLATDFDQYRQQMIGYSNQLMQSIVPAQLAAFSQQMQQSSELFNFAKENTAFYDSVYKPLREQFAKTAAEYDSPERRAAEMARASADVKQSFDAARRNEQQRLEGYGIDPSETRNQALNKGVAVMEAAAQAQARTDAARRVEDRGLELQNAAIGQGDAMLNRDINLMGMADQYGRTGAQMGSTAMNNAATGYGIGMQGYNTQMGLTQGTSNLYNDATRTELGSHGAQMADYNSTVDPMQAAFGLGATALGGWAGGGFKGLSEGGVVPEPNAPVAPPPTDPRGTDITPAALTPGEFVIPEEAVRWKGEEYFHKQVAKAKEDAASAKGAPAGALPAPQQGATA